MIFLANKSIFKVFNLLHYFVNKKKIIALLQEIFFSTPTFNSLPLRILKYSHYTLIYYTIFYFYFLNLPMNVVHPFKRTVPINSFTFSVC
jgi:hypothetical protein